MKQVSQNYKTGKIILEDVQAPLLKDKGVLVQTFFSLISIGTEGMKVREGKLSYLGKARARPDQFKKVLNSVKQQGIIPTYQKVINRLDSLTPLGYSLSGCVIAVGPGAEEFHVNQRVACAGAGFANHAEINYIPKNLCVPVPDAVSMKHASFATVGAIALQGLRQSNIQIGETACVIGLGLIGQLLVQLLSASGAQVLGVDLIQSRCRLAEQLGAKYAFTPDDPKLQTIISHLTGSYGVDYVFIASGGKSNLATELAAQITRDRATIIDIGKTKLDLPWNDFYLKELDVRFSRSYGPGRYDTTYEEKGLDYPIGYVRWTERRNIAAFLELVAEGKVQIEPIISEIFPFEDAEVVYHNISQSDVEFLGTVFDYGVKEKNPTLYFSTNLTDQNLIRKKSERLRLGVIGAGNYASSMLFPHLMKNKNVELVSVCATTSLSAQNAQRKFGFKTKTTDYREIIQHSDIDAILIATRHDTHAMMVSESLRSGKATYVEKPLAINFQDVELVRTAINESGNEKLMVGFNRRFSPMIKKFSQWFSAAHIPTVAHYRVHAGQLDSGSWYLDPSQGTRFIGEAGHFFDVLSYIVGSRPVSVSARALRPASIIQDDLENMIVTVGYQNGSIGSLFYLTQGGASVPKEYIESFGGGMTVQLHNFESLVYFGNGNKKKIKSMQIDKGQKSELDSFVESILSGNTMPISLDDLFDTTLTTLCAWESMKNGKVIEIQTYQQEMS